MAQQGNILVKAYTSNSLIPVPNATVLITRPQPDAQRQNLFAIQYTDESGLTPPISIDTPDSSVSLQPNNGVGWSTVDLLVEHPRYETVVIRGLQVFPGEQTIQNVQLIPLAQFPEVWNRTEEIQISPQNL